MEASRNMCGCGALGASRARRCDSRRSPASRRRWTGAASATLGQTAARTGSGRSWWVLGWSRTIYVESSGVRTWRASAVPRQRVRILRRGAAAVPVWHSNRPDPGGDGGV